MGSSIDTDRLISDYTCQNSNKIKKITDILSTSFGITEFWHYSIRQDGRFSYLANHPDISAHYWGSKLYKMCPLFKHPDNFEPILTLSNSVKDKDYYTSQGEIQNKFNMQLPFHIIQKQNGICHGFGFATRNFDFPLDTICINHLPRLQKFCDYFLQETFLIEKKLLDEGFNIGELIGKSFYESKPFIHIPVNLKDFYKKIRRTNFWMGEIPKLSKREKQCLHFFLRGNNCREIGENLNLTTRTIETYFAEIKNKLNCRTKSELFVCVQELDQFGLI